MENTIPEDKNRPHPEVDWRFKALKDKHEAVRTQRIQRLQRRAEARAAAELPNTDDDSPFRYTPAFENDASNNKLIAFKERYDAVKRHRIEWNQRRADARTESLRNTPSELDHTEKPQNERVSLEDIWPAASGDDVQRHAIKQELTDTEIKQELPEGATDDPVPPTEVLSGHPPSKRFNRQRCVSDMLFTAVKHFLTLWRTLMRVSKFCLVMLIGILIVRAVVVWTCYFLVSSYHDS